MPENNPVIISVDTASESLLPKNALCFAGNIDLAIDHHGSNTGFAQNTYLMPHEASCGEVIAGLLPSLGGKLTPSIANCLYLAIATDTGCFRFSNTSASTLRAAADMVEAGCDAYNINRVMFETKTLARFQLEGRLSAQMELLYDGKLAFSYLPRIWMEELGLTEDDIDSISGFPRSIEGVEIGIMVRELINGNCKLSMRTSPAYNASEICGHFGGGGHVAAAGATIEADYQQVRKMVLEAVVI